MRKIIVLLLILLVGIGVVFILRFIVGGNEDTWICVNNQWVKHGSPSSLKPLSGCGEKYELYKTDDFEVKYPYWPKIDPKNILEPSRTKIAVVNVGCNFVITKSSLPNNTNFQNYIEKFLEDEVAKTNSKVITKNIKDNTAYFEGEIKMGNVTLHSISYTYLTSKKNLYGIGFIAQNTQFDIACKPIIQEVISSVVIR